MTQEWKTTMPYAAKQRNTYCTTENTSINHIPVKMFIYQNGQLACFFLYQTFSSKSVLRSTATGKKKKSSWTTLWGDAGFWVCLCVCGWSEVSLAHLPKHQTMSPGSVCRLQTLISWCNMCYGFSSSALQRCSIEWQTPCAVLFLQMLFFLNASHFTYKEHGCGNFAIGLYLYFSN